MSKLKTKIIDASNQAVSVTLTPNEGQNTHIICQGLNQVDIYLPTKNVYKTNTLPITISRDKIQQSVFIHATDARFQNPFDLEYTTTSLDLFYSKTLYLCRESRLHGEWHVIGTGPAGYPERSISAEIYGTSFAVTGTQSAYFFHGGYQTSATATSYPEVRSYLYDHGFADVQISTSRGDVHILKPGLYDQEFSLNLLSESTEPTTFRLRLRSFNDYTYEESSLDVYITALAGTHTHNVQRKLQRVFLSNIYATHTTFNTSGSAYDKYIFKYDIVVTGNGTWYFSADSTAYDNAGWINRIKYTLLGDPTLAHKVANRTSFEE